MQRSLLSHKLKAVTLQETLVALLIIGIIASIAIPVLMPMITKAKSLEAKTQLEHVHRLQKTYFYEYSKYTADLPAIGFEQEDLVSESETGKANYRIEIVNASANTFIARATAVVDFDGDGEYNVWEIDEKRNLAEVVKD
jgi:type IV pilus assembly protein PilE